jgi:RND family efflux transporter MFP subunit
MEYCERKPVVKRVIVWGALLLSAACNGTGAEPQQEAQPPQIQIGRESVAIVKMDEIRTGPLITGQLAPETEATVRAKIGGSVVQTSFDEGQAVAKGAVLARIEARDLQDASGAAAVAVTSAENALKLVQSELQRTESLVKGGALAQRDLENARNAVANAESQVAAARARASSARAQLADTTVRAPIAGVVSVKAVNTGDVVAPGAALYTIIDPTSMRLEASVPSDQIGSLRPGVPVVFTVRGYEGQDFSGRIERISPVADPVTRQVSIFVSIPNSAGRLIAGLYAEGRVESQVRRGLTVPANAVDMTAGSPAVTRVRDGKADRVTVTIGLRDRETERIEILTGLAEGDVLLVGAARGVTPGTPVTINQ